VILSAAGRAAIHAVGWGGKRAWRRSYSGSLLPEAFLNIAGAAAGRHLLSALLVAAFTPEG